MKKYYFKSTQWGYCLEPCKVKNDRTMIGSVACQECPLNNSINNNRRKNLLIKNEWTTDIENQKIKIDKT